MCPAFWKRTPEIVLPFLITSFEWRFRLLKWTILRTPPHVTPYVEQLIAVLKGEMHRDEILDELGLTDRKNFRENYLNPAFEAKLIEYTIPDKPKSKHQKYRLTEQGKAYKKKGSQ